MSASEDKATSKWCVSISMRWRPEVGSFMPCAPSTCAKSTSLSAQCVWNRSKRSLMPSSPPAFSQSVGQKRIDRDDLVVELYAVAGRKDVRQPAEQRRFLDRLLVSKNARHRQKSDHGTRFEGCEARLDVGIGQLEDRLRGADVSGDTARLAPLALDVLGV